MHEREVAARGICRHLRDSGYRALLAGGCVRDLLLGAPPKDFDIATNATPEVIARLFPKTFDVGAKFGVSLVVLPEGNFEVATFRKDGPYLDGRHPVLVEFTGEREDALRRDFTINALFLDPESGEVHDCIGGRQDIEDRIIRCVGEPLQRFREDYLRMLRAVRFAARLDYQIDPSTLAAVRDLAPKITSISAERIRDEIVKILIEGGARRAFVLLDETGLLPHILPEIAAMKGIEQPPEFHPEGDVFVHTLLVLDALNAPTPTLAMGALLHDVGKPVTQTFEDRIRFNLHERVGADMARRICRRLRFPNDDAERIVWLVGQHMRVAAIPDMRESKRKRFVREPGFRELLNLCRADCLASHGDTSFIAWIENYIATLSPEEIRPVPLITGRDLIDMGYRPGPLFKDALQAVEDAQLEGAISDAESARRFIIGRFGPPSLPQ